MTTLTVDADHITITEQWPKACPLDDPTDCNGEHCDCPLTRSAVIVMDGEPEYNSTYANGFITRPPGQVRRLAEPCQTCDGEGVRHNLGQRWKERCVDCHNGKPTFTLHQRCVPMCVNGTVGRWADGHLCGYCDGSGVIDLGDGWTITEVLPMHDGGTKLDTYPPDAFYWTKGEGWWRDSQFDKIVTMPPAAKPGMFVVFAEQETP